MEDNLGLELYPSIGLDSQTPFPSNNIMLIPVIGYAIIHNLNPESIDKNKIKSVPIYADFGELGAYDIVVREYEEILNIVPSTERIFKIVATVPQRGTTKEEIKRGTYDIEDICIGHEFAPLDEGKQIEYEQKHKELLKLRGYE